jgi:hypothetical protein
MESGLGESAEGIFLGDYAKIDRRWDDFGCMDLSTDRNIEHVVGVEEPVLTRHAADVDFPEGAAES